MSLHSSTSTSTSTGPGPVQQHQQHRQQSIYLVTSSKQASKQAGRQAPHRTAPTTSTLPGRSPPLSDRLRVAAHASTTTPAALSVGLKRLGVGRGGGST